MRVQRRKGIKNVLANTAAMAIFAARISIMRPVRLSARTSPFHGGKRGSIPLRATKPCTNHARLFLFSFPSAIGTAHIN